jgi:hypothetical protein
VAAHDGCCDFRHNGHTADASRGAFTLPVRDPFTWNVTICSQSITIILLSCFDGLFDHSVGSFLCVLYDVRGAGTALHVSLFVEGVAWSSAVREFGCSVRSWSL